MPPSLLQFILLIVVISFSLLILLHGSLPFIHQQQAAGQIRHASAGVHGLASYFHHDAVKSTRDWPPIPTDLGLRSSRESTSLDGISQRRNVDNLACRTLIGTDVIFTDKSSAIRCAGPNNSTIAMLFYSTRRLNSHITTFVSYLNRIHYAQRHGYAFCFATTHIDRARHPAWNKLPVILSILHSLPTIEWIFMLDSDAIILSTAARVEDRVPEVDFRPGSGSHTATLSSPSQPFAASNPDILLTADYDTPRGKRPVPKKTGSKTSLNTGAILIRNTPYIGRLFEEIYNNYPKTIDHFWWEQMAIRECASKVLPCMELDRHAYLLSWDRLNSHRPLFSHEAGDFVSHWAGSGGSPKVHQINGSLHVDMLNFVSKLVTRTMDQSVVADLTEFVLRPLKEAKMVGRWDTSAVDDYFQQSLQSPDSWTKTWYEMEVPAAGRDGKLSAAGRSKLYLDKEFGGYVCFEKDKVV